MTLANEYQETIKKFKLLPVSDQNKMLKKVTANHMTPKLKYILLNLKSIPGIGDVKGRAILFAIGMSILKYE